MTLTKDQLAQDAFRLMKANKANSIYATTDGNFFLKKHEAETHLRDVNTNKLDGLHELVPFEEAEAETSSAQEQDDAERTKSKKADTSSTAETTKAPKKPKEKKPQVGEQSAAKNGDASNTGGEATKEAVAEKKEDAATETGSAAANA